MKYLLLLLCLLLVGCSTVSPSYGLAKLPKGSSVLNKPRFTDLHVIAAYNEKDQMVNCIVKANFVVTAISVDGVTKQALVFSIEPFDLLKNKDHTFTNKDGVMNTYGGLAADVLGVLEQELWINRPGPLPITPVTRSENIRKALREQSPP